MAATTLTAHHFGQNLVAENPTKFGRVRKRSRSDKSLAIYKKVQYSTVTMSKHRLEADADPEVLRQEKKRRKKEKRDRKEALRLQDITPSSTDVTAESTPAPEQVEDEATYTQSPTLTDLPQTTIDEYLASQNVQISDPQSAGLRPVLAFSQLPKSIISSYDNAFSNFEKPSSIQSSAWPFLLSGRDVIGVAETGSGKTLAFGLPLVVRLANMQKRKGIRAVIVAPTRELAIQVFEQIDGLCKASPAARLKATCVYGGTNKDEQRRALGKDTNIIVATPGRLKDFMSDETINVSKTRYLVLDEADRMLDKGFEEDIKQIINSMPSSSKRQTAMFTATWPKSIRELASTFMNKPVKITIGRDATDLETDGGELRANPRIKQIVEVVQPDVKQSRLLQLLKQHTSGAKSKDRILVFCLYKKEATRIENFIQSRGFNVAGIHGDLSQSAREASLNAFKAGKVTILVATDVAARGLDIPNVRVVINVTFPLTAEDYVHRIGRTGRAGKDGLAVTLFTEHDKPLAGALINVLKGANQEVPEDLLKFGTTVKKKQHATYGAFFKEAEDGKIATKITFDD